MKDQIQQKFTDGREPRQTDWYNLVDQSKTDFFVIDSTEDFDWERDDYVTTPAKTSELFCIGDVEKRVIDAQSLYENVKNKSVSTEELANATDGFLDNTGVVADGVYLAYGELYSPTDIPFENADDFIKAAFPEVFAEKFKLFLLHKDYVDYVVADGGEVLGLTQTLNLFNQLTND